MNYLIFNKTCVIDTPIEGNNSMVRTGGTSFNENDPFISFANALLHSTMKKYGSIAESERMTKIQKLKDDIYKKIKNGEKFKQKLSSFLEIVKETLSHFYKYLSSNDLEDLKLESNKKFSDRLLNDGDNDKIKLFKLLSEIITLEDFNKIFKMTEKKWISNNTCCVFDYNKIIQKETVRFLMYQEFFEDVDKKKSDFFVENIISMINELVKISFEQVSDEKNFLSNCITKHKIDILSNYMDLNIVFLDYQTRQPFFLGTETNLNNNKKTVILFSFDLKHYEIVGKHLPDDRIQRNFMPYDDIVKNIVYYTSMKSAVNIGPVKKNTEIINSDEKKIEQTPPIKTEEKTLPPIVEEENKPTPIKEEEKTIPPPPIEEEKSQQTPIEQIENVEKNIKENIYYNSDDEMLRELGDSLYDEKK